MLVEDEAIAAMAVSHLLESLGYVVVGIADTGRAAIELASASHPDVVVMDVRLKGEMSGIESAKVIRERFGLPVIFTTAYTTEEIRKEHEIDESFQFVTKPIRKANLVRAISAACGKD
jgi:two-component system response regulator